MPSNITAADHGGAVPATSISCPIDDEKIKAQDIRGPVAALLANDDDLYAEIAAINAAVSVTTTSITTLNTVGIGGASLEDFTTFPGYTASGYVILDLADASVGDVIDASLTLDLQTDAAAGDYTLKLVTVEDYGGAATETDMPGAKWLTRTASRIQMKMQGVRVVATAGPLRVLMKVSLPSGGTILNNYGTGALIVRKTHVGP